MYIKHNGSELIKFPYSISDFRKDNANTSFPKIITEATLAEFGVSPITVQEAPSYDQQTQKAVLLEDNPIYSDGVWCLSWEVVNKTEEEMAEELAAAASQVRDKRNKLLSLTDYLALTDSTLTPEMAAYRQALRDVPAQDGFPHSVVWPTKP